MSVRSVSFVPGEYYHIFNRGTDKREIFHDDVDRQRFIKLLYIANSDRSVVVRDFSKNIYNTERGKQLISIGAYCLMPNHFHLLVTQTENGDISKFMLKLCTAYSMYYNKKYSRTGTLFESKFKSEYIDNDRWLKYLFSYIHLNPLKLIDKEWKKRKLNSSKFLDFLISYKFSSYIDYMGVGRSDEVVINRKDFPNYFSSIKDFESEIMAWISLA